MVNRLRVHIVHEYGIDLRPHASSWVRLLRPLGHPSLAQRLEVTFSPRYDGLPVDAVIVDRLWRPDIAPDLARELVADVRRARARLIYALDDNILDLPAERADWPLPHHLETLYYLLGEADAIWVPTDALKERLADCDRPIRVLPNQLDERLIVGGRRRRTGSPLAPGRLVLGYMGTLTHGRDLELIRPALERVFRRHAGKLELQLVGVAEESELVRAFQELGARPIPVPPEETEYPLFQLWFTGRVAWDVALAPLCDTPFARCKSDLKFLDYCAIGAAGIYSRVAPYAASVRHGETGWLVENDEQAWEEALETLLTDAALRERLGTGAARYLYTERTLAVRAGQWLEALEEVLEQAG